MWLELTQRSSCQCSICRRLYIPNRKNQPVSEPPPHPAPRPNTSPLTTPSRRENNHWWFLRRYLSRFRTRDRKKSRIVFPHQFISDVNASLKRTVPSFFLLISSSFRRRSTSVDRHWRLCCGSFRIYFEVPNGFGASFSNQWSPGVNVVCVCEVGIANSQQLDFHALNGQPATADILG